MNARCLLTLAVVLSSLVVSCKKGALKPENRYTGLSCITVKHRYPRTDSAGKYDVIPVKYNLKYDGSNIISAIPDVHPGYYGVQRFSYSGGNLTGITEFFYNNDNPLDTLNFFENQVYYTKEGKVDSIIRKRDGVLSEKYAFIYSGADYTIRRGGWFMGFFTWDPNSVWVYHVSGGNTIIDIYSKPNLSITTGDVPNNLGQSLPYLFIFSNVLQYSYWYTYPICMPQMSVTSIAQISRPDYLTTITNEVSAGKITRSVWYYQYLHAADTILYEYVQ